MRDFPVDSISFEKEIRKSAIRMVHRDLETLRSDVVNNSNSLYDNLSFYFLKDVSQDDLIRLSIASWFLPEEVGFVLRLDLEMKLNKLEEENRNIVEILLQSKSEMLIYLQETNLWHSRDFFGNILGPTVNLSKHFNLSPLRRKVNRPKRKRGYDDKGSKVSDTKWKPRFDWSLTNLQNEIEAKRQSQRDTLNLIRGFLW